MDAQTFLDNFGPIAEAPGGTGRLRELILHLALAGRLVQADTDDEPVDTLLGRLVDDRQWTMTEWAFREPKVGPAIRTDEQPHDVPAHWTWVRLAEVAYPQAGFAFKSNGFNAIARGLPLVRIRDIGTGETECFFDGDFREEFVIDQGDYLVGMDGNFNVRQWKGTRALLNQRVTRLVFFGDEVERQFVVWALQRAINNLHGSRAYTTVQHLSGKQIAGSVIPLPPVGEQKRIVAKADELMQLCDDLEARQQARNHITTRLRASSLDALKTAEAAKDLYTAWSRVHANWDALTGDLESIGQLRELVVALAIRGRLVPHEQAGASSSTDSRLPLGWRRGRLGDFITLISGQHLKPDEYNTAGDGIPYLTGPADFGDDGPVASRWTESRKAVANQGDILLTVKGAGIGKIAVLRDPEAAISRQLMALRPVGVIPGYLRLVVAALRQDLRSHQVGIAIPGIGRKDVESAVIVIPPVSEQERIVESVNDLQRQCDELERRLRHRDRLHHSAAASVCASAGASESTISDT